MLADARLDEAFCSTIVEPLFTGYVDLCSVHNTLIPTGIVQRATFLLLTVVVVVPIGF